MILIFPPIFSIFIIAFLLALFAWILTLDLISPFPKIFIPLNFFFIIFFFNNNSSVISSLISNFFLSIKLCISNKLKELSNLIEGILNSSDNSDILIEDISPLHTAKSSDITFFSNLSFKDELIKTSAGACIIKEDHKIYAPDKLPLIICEDPYFGFALVSQKFYPKELSTNYLSGLKDNSKSSISESAVLEKNVIIEKGAVIGDGVKIGKNSFIGSSSVIGANVQIGKDCYVGANVSITHTLISDNVKIHNGTSIGQDGFGFAMSASGHEKIPQIGLVEIKDNVEIGANCTIDRGTSENTIVDSGTKIDNMVHIGHNLLIM